MAEQVGSVRPRQPNVELKKPLACEQIRLHGQPDPKANVEFWLSAKQRVSGLLAADPDQSRIPIESWLKFVFQIGFIGAVLIAIAWLVRDPVQTFLLYGIAAFPLLGLVLAFGHDACHGTASGRPWINLAVLNLSFLAHGADPELQRIRHVGSHHRFPASHDQDAEYALVKLIRVFPCQKRRWFHRFQHWYAWLLYLVGTPFVVWVWEFVQVVRGKVDGYGSFNRDRSFTIRFLARKITHTGLWIGLPLVVGGHAPWIILIGYAGMHGIFSLIFLSISVGTHLHVNARFPTMGPEAPVRGSAAWVDEQISSSVNIAADSRLVRWFLGSIATHAAHHLFPSVPHGRIEPIRQVVDRASRENGVALINASLLGVLAGHWLYLRALSGVMDAAPPSIANAASVVTPSAQPDGQQLGNCDRDFLTLCEMTRRDFCHRNDFRDTGSFWAHFERSYLQLSRAAISRQDQHPFARWRRYQRLRHDKATPFRRLQCLQVAIKAHLLDDLPIAICATYAHCQDLNEPLAAPDTLREVFLAPETTQTFQRVDRNIRAYLASEFSRSELGKRFWMLALYLGQQMPFGMNARKTQALRRQAWQIAIVTLQSHAARDEVA